MPGENEIENSNTPTPTPATTETPTPTPAETPTPTPGEEEPKSLINNEEDKGGDPPVEFTPLTADDLTFTEGFEVQDEFRDDFLKIVNDQEMSHKDRAQALTGLYEKAVTQQAEASTTLWAETQTKWRDEVKADPEIGGDKLQPTLGRISRLLSEYGNDKTLQAFDLTGAGNHPEIVRLLGKLADKLVEPEATVGAPTNQRGDAASRLFPSMPN